MRIIRHCENLRRKFEAIHYAHCAFLGANLVAAKSKRKMKRNALTRAVKILDFGLPRVGNRVERIWSFDFALEIAENSRIARIYGLLRYARNDELSLREIRLNSKFFLKKRKNS